MRIFTVDDGLSRGITHRLESVTTPRNSGLIFTLYLRCQEVVAGGVVCCPGCLGIQAFIYPGSMAVVLSDLAPFLCSSRLSTSTFNLNLPLPPLQIIRSARACGSGIQAPTEDLEPHPTVTALHFSPSPSTPISSSRILFIQGAHYLVSSCVINASSTRMKQRDGGAT